MISIKTQGIIKVFTLQDVIEYPNNLILKTTKGERLAMFKHSYKDPNTLSSSYKIFLGHQEELKDPQTKITAIVSPKIDSTYKTQNIWLIQEIRKPAPVAPIPPLMLPEFETVNVPIVSLADDITNTVKKNNIEAQPFCDEGVYELLSGKNSLDDFEC